MQIRDLVLATILLASPASAALAAGGAGAEAPQAPASKLNIEMTIYAAGVTLGKVDLDATLRNNEYQAVSHLETAGVVNAFWKAKIQATSTGALASSGRFQPALYNAYSANRDNPPREVSVTFDSKGVRVYSNPAYDDLNEAPITDTQKKEGFDPVSAIVYIMSGAGLATSDNLCNVVAPVFDGRRRYNIEITKEKDVNVDMDNGIYKGPAVQCLAKYKQIAGFRQRVLESSKKFPGIHAWVTTFPSKIPGQRYVVPLRVWADTSYGLIAVVTTSLKIDGAEKKVTSR
jgi:hypothetical protein